MPRFYYQATTLEGKVVKGHHQADEAIHVRDHLREQGLLPIWVTEVQDSLWKGHLKRWSLADRVVWMQQLAAALEAHLPLLDALGMLLQQSAQGTVAREINQSIYTAVQQGQPLDYALKAFPRYFDRMTLTIVRSGLESGQLPAFLTDLAKDWEAQQVLRQKILAASLYPVLVGGVSLLMTVGLLFYLTPTLENLFAKHWDQLPWITRFMIGLGHGLRRYGVWVALLLMAVGLGAYKQAQKIKYQKMLQHMMLRIPGLGYLRVLLDSARMSQILGILVSSGVPLLKALEVAIPSLGLYLLKDALERIRESVKQGGSLSRAFRQEDLFPSMLIHWVESGERSGELGERLQQSARQLQREAERRLLLVTSILEPLLILGTGCIVLVLVLSILLPMTSIQQLVK